MTYLNDKFITIALALLIYIIPSNSQGSDGGKIYAEHCALCHDTGISNAPKKGDTHAWNSRSMNSLIQIALTGKGSMPPKGGCNTCTEDDLKAAIEYMK